MSEQSSMDFDYFEAGRHIGTYRMALAPMVAEWQALFPEDSEAGQGAFAPPGVMVAAMMRGYTQIVNRRPPGNVHAGQILHWGEPAAVEAELIVDLSCAEKELRHDRRWLVFRLTIDGARGERHLTADMRFLWAA